jgi:hypothetical protein
MLFDSRWTYDGNNSPEFERAVAVMHESSMWMLGEEEGLSGDLVGHSSGRWSDGCGLAVRSGSSDDLISSKSEFLRKRNPKEGRELIQ